AHRSAVRRCWQTLCVQVALDQPRSISEAVRRRHHERIPALPGDKMNRQDAEKRGRGAETIACWYLRLHGWRILARRARVPGGEVEVIARRGRTVAFVAGTARA